MLCIQQELNHMYKVNWSVRSVCHTIPIAYESKLYRIGVVPLSFGRAHTHTQLNRPIRRVRVRFIQTKMLCMSLGSWIGMARGGGGGGSCVRHSEIIIKWTREKKSDIFTFCKWVKVSMRHAPSESEDQARTTQQQQQQQNGK